MEKNEKLGIPLLQKQEINPLAKHKSYTKLINITK